MAAITLNSPTFVSANQNYINIGFVDTFDDYKSYTGGKITLTGASYETTTKTLTITATYNRVGFNSQGIYLSLNNDRTSLGTGSSYTKTGSGWGNSVGKGEYYAVRTSGTITTVTISNSNTSNIAWLKKEGGSSSGQGVTGITMTVSAVVEPSVINSGEVPIFFRSIYNSGWKPINESRWLTDTTFKRDITEKVKFSTSIKTYTITYDGFGGTTPADQTKIEQTAITLAGPQTKDSLWGLTGATVSFDGSGGTPQSASLTNTRDVHYSFVNWVSSNEAVYYEPYASFTNDHDDTMIANYAAENVWYNITLPSATRASTTLYRTITYNGNTGTPTKTSADSTATRSYTFGGWKNSNNVYVGTTGDHYQPTSSHTLYALWSSSDSNYSSVTLPGATKSSTKEYRTVTLNANGGTVSVNSLTSTATRTYTHSGWYTSTSGGTLRGKSGDSYVPNASETLYAQYTSTLGNYSAVVLPTPTRKDYIFKGWALNASASSGITGSYTPSSDVTFYATWEEDQAKMYIKNDQGTWKKGKVFILDNNKTWRKAKKIYIKQDDGTWRLGKNS